MSMNNLFKKGDSTIDAPTLATSRKLVFSLVTILGFILLGELGLRLFGLPSGTFRMVEPGAAGLWPPNFNEELTLGPVPYRVVANADGFRGPPLRRKGEVFRVVCIGDSLTEGFYVDNPYTYPASMQRALDELGHEVEVINAGRGGGSIDRFIGIFEQAVRPLEPDLIVITWVNNDPWELGLKGFQPDRPTGPDTLIRDLLIHSALGEGMMRMALHRHEHYRGASEAEGDQRYQIDGWEDTVTNSAHFLSRFNGARLLLVNEHNEEMKAKMTAYAAELDRFFSIAGDAGIPVLYLVIPSYPEVHIDAPRTYLKTILPVAQRQGVAVLDMLPLLQEAEGPITLAPVDYHLNPAGNRLLGEAVADRVVQLMGSKELEK